MPSSTRESPRVVNFGGNVRFSPRHRYSPRTETEVLQILDRHADGKIRAIGSLHSWSDVAATQDVSIDLRHFDTVDVSTASDGTVHAWVGAGCRLHSLLAELRKVGVTLPAIGAVTEQTIAGAVSTATHGSGRPSMSHFVEEIRLAAYDPATGTASVFVHEDGAELRAARCALGCMGIILAVRLRCVPEYHVADAFVRREHLADILARADEFPLQQFVLIPYLWSYWIYQRRVAERERGAAARARLLLRRAYSLIAVDVFLHLVIKGLVALSDTPAAVTRFYRAVFPHLVLGRTVVADRSDRVLTLEHELFRHEELELFVPLSHLEAALALTRAVVSTCAAGGPGPPEDVQSALRQVGMLDQLGVLRGSYTHHYPIFCRSVLPDDTLISMTAGATEPFYTISFFTYLRPERREPFYRMARYLSHAMLRLYGARPHWGKYFPLGNRDIEPLVPGLEQFRRICATADPLGTFQNDFAERVLGFSAR